MQAEIGDHPVHSRGAEAVVEDVGGGVVAHRHHVQSEVAPAHLGVVGESGRADTADAVAGCDSGALPPVELARLDRTDERRQHEDLEHRCEHDRLVGADRDLRSAVDADLPRVQEADGAGIGEDLRDAGSCRRRDRHASTRRSARPVCRYSARPVPSSPTKACGMRMPFCASRGGGCHPPSRRAPPVRGRTQLREDALHGALEPHATVVVDAYGRVGHRGRIGPEDPVEVDLHGECGREGSAGMRTPARAARTREVIAW